MVLEGLYKSKLQDSVQLQTVLALYEQENIRNNEQLRLSRLKTSARRHIDQTMRTRNFRVQNETVEGGSVTKSQKERKRTMRGKCESVFSGRHVDNVQKETHEVSVLTDQYMETCTVVRDEKDDRFLPHQIRRPRLTKE